MHSKRISFIDGLRGFSLLGILLANLLIFQYGMYGKDDIETTSFLNEAALKFVKVAVEGSAMPIFTFVFGYSFIKLVESIRNKGKKSRWSILRRSTGLILLGFLHATYLWDGDILLFYGSIMIVLLPFINRKPKTLFIWATILFVLTTALGYGQVDSTTKEEQEMKEYNELAYDTYGNGTYREIYEFRNDVMPPGFEDPIFIIILLIVAPFIYIPMFLFGMGVAKLGAFENLVTERKWYVRGSIFVPIGLICKALGLLKNDWAGVLSMGGSMLLSIGYISLFALLYETNFFVRIRSVFENVGKLSLSNYILQTVICTFVFYGYGFGLFGQLGVAMGVLLGIVIYILQCILSTLYLKKFKRGPLEVLLRMWTNFSWSGRPKA
ncbi:DUF418 domain-containing protein [Ureibacillus endophyticus]|uniref:DUF418 domain-containing protein n=1 Tax=Ureibacillus endophyticus TaxID=1978490 RepID=A0A494Z6E8_9BACL|nr:DUF418 domain-containing protein [Lysinibacillus endophyticus]RKQ18137.1 DUF418 domain-containing protein [Lysinibacillus endophyticus]